MEINEILTPADLYGKELYIKGSRVRVRATMVEWNGKTQTGSVDVKFIDVPDENCYKICETLNIHPNGDSIDNESKWYYEGKFNIKDLTKVPYGSELGKVLYGAQKIPKKKN